MSALRRIFLINAFVLVASTTTLEAYVQEGVVRLGPKTTVCKSYSSAVIARQIREGGLTGNPLPKDCAVYGLNSNAAVQIDGKIKSVSVLLSDGTYSDYWVGGDDVYAVLARNITLSWGEMFKSQVEKCWKERKPYGITTHPPKAHFSITLERDGSVNGTPVAEYAPTTPYLRVYQEAAVRSIMDCQPYSLPDAEFDQWKKFTIQFLE